VRVKGKVGFLVLRRGYHTLQCVMVENGTAVPKEMMKFAGKIPSESVVDIYGKLSKPEKAIEAASIKSVELNVQKLFVVSAAYPILPFQIDDAAAPEPEEEHGAPKEKKDEKKDEKKGEKISVGQMIRLDNRWIDLRTPANHAIFRLQSAVGQYYRQFFINNGFIEIHSPKMTPGVSEGGASVFRFPYFGTPACLAQSPQLFKQMAVLSDLFKVFEIGPVFRAENSFTHRHLCEFTGLDFEMEIKEHYHEVLQVLGDLFVYIFENIEKHNKHELNAIAHQYPFSPLKYEQKTRVVSFPDAIALLREAGEKTGDFDDFSTPQEKLLGKIIKAKYDTDFYIIDRYPVTARPFYTMIDCKDPRYTNSYDVFLRGEEITSGAQRVHDVEMLKRRATECNIPLPTLHHYLESFRYGAYPHGGAGIGLERVVMLYLGLNNIRKTSLFPRDPTRISP
jgi:aspartyl-tRNA synthetase